MRERLFARGVPIGQLASDWAAVVGERLAAESAPVSLDGGVLVVAATDGPWGAQVRFLAGEIAKKANAVLGDADGRTRPGRRPTDALKALALQGPWGCRGRETVASGSASRSGRIR